MKKMEPRKKQSGLQLWYDIFPTSPSKGTTTRSNNRRTTHFGQRILDHREEVAEKGTIFDDKLGEEYREAWFKKSRDKSKQKIFGNISQDDIDLSSVEIIFHRVRQGDINNARRWKIFADSYHYVPHSKSSIKPYGRFLRYFIKVNGRCVGIIAVSGSILSLGMRDEWIGWNKEQRMRNNKKICHNLVYCILPSVKVPNLSSKILSKFTQRVRKDWKEQYGDSLVLMDTLVDPELYAGTSYLAAGWNFVGMTRGFGAKSVRKDVKGYGAENMGRVLFKHGIPKRIFVKPLHRYWRKELHS